MDNKLTFKDYILMLKETDVNKSVLTEEFQDVTNDDYSEDEYTDEDYTYLDDEGTEEMGYDPNAMFDPSLDTGTTFTVEQKKTLLIDYFDKLMEQIKIVRDHIDLISFDTNLLIDTTVGISELQFGLEELRVKIEKYIEDQFVEDKYERSLYLYLTFVEEFKLNVRILNRQQTKNNK